MSGRLDPRQVIATTRDGGQLTPDVLRGFLDAYLDGEVSDAQMAAWLMAGLLRGLTTDEAVATTEAFVDSGEVIDLSSLAGPTVDKHSTGGVGDTCTLVVAPLLAACGAQVAKLSGRALGHTGGTLDKLQSIPGLRVDLSGQEVRDQVERIGVAIAAATERLVPLDKRLYALRDLTATVASPALIAASVMSKKLAGGAQHVLLDVKCGDGAFLHDVDDAVALSRMCCDIGRAHGRRTGALVTDMSQPLSAAVGNALEVAHAVEVLNGDRAGRFRDLSLDLAASALELTGVEVDMARGRVEQALGSGDAAEVFRDLVASQGGDPAVVDTPWNVLDAAPHVLDVTAGPGTMARVHCRRLGELAAGLGAAPRHGNTIDPGVGIELLVAIGEQLDHDQPVARIHARTAADGAQAQGDVAACFEMTEGDLDAPPLVWHRMMDPQ